MLVIVLVGWLPGVLLLPPLDRDESRFAEASRQMVESGNYIDIRFANAPRYNKPVGIYWLQSASTLFWGPALRDRIWVYRLPSLLGGLLSLMFLYALARAIAPPKTALLASLLLGTTFLLTIESTMATTDAALLAAIIAAQAALMRVYLAAHGKAQPSRMLVYGGWAALGAGLLLKGPVIAAVLVVTALALSLWDRNWRWLSGARPLSGAALALVIVAPWAIAIALTSHGAFYRQSLGHDFGAKILGGEESHGAPPGYYFVLASVTFWPAILLLLPALQSAILKRDNPAIRFLIAWSGATWLLFECVPTKLPHYILPAYPALALLAAVWATAPKAGTEGRWARILRYVACAQFATVALALAGLCLFLPGRFGGTVGLPLLAGAAVGVLAACAAVVLLFRRRAECAAAPGMSCALVFDLLLAFAVAPQLHQLWLSPRAAALVAAHRNSARTPVVLDGYVEPSLVFLLGSDTHIESPAGAAVAAQEGGLALVERRVQPLFLSDLRRLGRSASPLGSVSGLDYSTGREQHMTLYRVSRELSGPSK